MVGVLIPLRRAQRRHLVEQIGTPWLLLAGVLALVSAAGTLWLAGRPYPAGGAATDVVALTVALWAGGTVAPRALGGTETLLPPGLLQLLPLDVSVLARAYLVLGLLDPALVLVAAATAALVVLGARTGGVGVVAVAVVAWLLTVLLTAVGAVLAGFVLTPTTRRGRDAATVVPAVALSAVAVASTLLPLLLGALAHRSSPALSRVLRLLPTGWGALAVDQAGRGRPGLAAAVLVALAVLVAAGVAAVPSALRRRLAGSATALTAAAPRPPGRRRLPATPTGAVVSTELRTWLRDPFRLTALLVAVLVGAGVATAPWLTSGTTLLLPFGGLLTVVVAGAVASNLYGADGTAIWLLATIPGSARPDVRGRQAAWLLVVAPVAAALTLVGTAVAGRGWAWPWVLALLPALLGGAAGLLVLVSVTSALPPAPSGGPSPAWSLQVHLCLYLIAVCGVPAAVLLVLGSLTGTPALAWLAVPVGLATGAALAWRLGRLAAVRLEQRQVALLARAAQGS